MEKQRSRPRIEVLGAYRIEPTDGLFSMAMDRKYGGLALSKKERHDAEQSTREELSSIILLEVSATALQERPEHSAAGQSRRDMNNCTTYQNSRATAANRARAAATCCPMR
jgi:hypothetical protein